MHDRRKAARSRTYLGGSIEFNQCTSAMDCNVRNLSPSGAKVTFTKAAVVPDRFDLTITRKQRSFRVRMAWRGVDEAGVEFLDEHTETTPIPLEWVRRLRDCEAEKATLLKRIAQLTENRN